MSIKEKLGWLMHKMKRRWLMHKIANRLIVSPATPINPSRLQSGWTLDNDISIVQLQRQSPDFDYRQKIRLLRKCWSSQTRWVGLIPLFWFHGKCTDCSTLTLWAEPALLGKNPKIARTRGWSFSFLQFCNFNLECDISYSKAHWSILRCVGIQRNKSFYIKLYLWFDSLFVLVPGNLSIFLYIKSTNYLYHIWLLVHSPPYLYWFQNSPGFALCSFFLRLHLKKYKLSKNNPRNCQKSFWERVLAGLRRRKEAL